MPMKRLLIGDAPVVAWSLQEALKPLLPISVHALGARLAFPPEAPDAFLLIEILLPGGGCGLLEDPDRLDRLMLVLALIYWRLLDLGI